MKRLNNIKNFIKKNKLTLLIIFLIVFICSFSLTYGYKKQEFISNQNSYSNNKQDAAINEILGNIASSEDQAIIDKIANSDIIVAPANDAEDPNNALKANKGNAKKDTASNAAKKYETNETSFGIDVSTYQGKIDWAKVKQSGVSFAMIRIGFRRLDSGTIVMDNTFKDNIAGALANNINVGVYFFSMAKNEAEAREEAAWVINIIKNYDISYPIAIDTEIFNQHRLKGVSNSQLTTNAIAFANYVKSYGYTPMIYSYLNAFNKNFETARFGNTRIWLAQYNDKVTYKGNYHMWQYTSNGSVPGIKGRVDMNVAYFSVTNDITKRSTVTGTTNNEYLPTVNFKSLNMDTKLTKSVTIRTSPYTTLPNKIGTLNNGTYITVTGIGKEFIRIKYNGTTYYINDLNCFQMNLPTVSFTDVSIAAKIKYKVNILTSPYNYLNNEAGALPSSTNIEVTGINDDFIRINYNNQTYYINDVNCYEEINEEIS